MDGVADGTFVQSNGTDMNQLGIDLQEYNCTHLYDEPEFNVYVNGTESLSGHISPKCAVDFKLPEDYCNLMEQECEAEAFIINPKVSF